MNEFRPVESNRHMPNAALTTAAFDALIAERDALRGELKVVKVERDLLKEKVNAFLR